MTRKTETTGRMMTANDIERLMYLIDNPGAPQSCAEADFLKQVRRIKGENFEIGDVVVLRSEGHTMTVIGRYDETVVCAWSNNREIRTKGLPSAALKRPNDDLPF